LENSIKTSKKQIIVSILLITLVIFVVLLSSCKDKNGQTDDNGGDSNISQSNIPSGASGANFSQNHLNL